MTRVLLKQRLLLAASSFGWVFSQFAVADFIHPGLLHTKEDLARIRVAIAEKQEPIFSGYEVLANSSYAKSDVAMNGPSEEWGRAPNIAMGQAAHDATCAYQNALMWCITGERSHANKAIEIINAWSNKHKRMVGVDGILAAGLQGFKFVNAAELLRHTNSGWTDQEAKRCETWLMNAVHPKIEHYAYFANGNWGAAALQTKMAIAVFCNDRALFEETVRNCVNGAGNATINHLIVYPSGQCQETSRAQHYAQLGLGLLGNTAEVAWNQGVDLYGWNDNRILKGFEYTAKYGFGEDVPYQHYLDRTGKYGLGGRHQQYNKISTVSRGSFWPIFERIYQHYEKRRGIAATYSGRVAKQKRPERFNHDHIGLGTLTHWRSRVTPSQPQRAPGIPSGLVANTTRKGIQLSWVKSVDPVSARDADSYTVRRATTEKGPFALWHSDIKTPQFVDSKVNQGQLYFYSVTAKNSVAESAASKTLGANAGLPGPWKSVDVGSVGVPGFTEFDGARFTVEAEGNDIGGSADEFHFVYAPMKGEGTITARIVRPMSSQWTKLGVTMRETLEPGSRHASVLLLPPNWSGALVSRSETDGETRTDGKTPLPADLVEKKNRLLAPYWVRLIKFRNTFTGFMSSDGIEWKRLGMVEIQMGSHFYVGLPACSQLEKVTTTATFDHVSIPIWRTPDPDRIIAARPQPRWHAEQWRKRHQSFNDRVKQGNVDMIMIGDSITHWFDKAGKKVWDQYYGHRNAVNLAISGDRTEHVLWRLENGNLEGISPKLAVLMIGTNNHISSPPETTAADIRTIVKLLRKKLPTTKVLVLAIFPRGADDRDGARQTNMKVNRLISDIGDGKNVFFENINEAFLTNRRLSTDIVPDFTHPNEKGYAVWAEAMEPMVEKLMQD